MDIIHLSNHCVRKALRLSLNEMAVLCDIKQLSQNRKYDYWCIKSKDKIAEWLDLSRATVFRAIDTLSNKGYIEKSDKGLRLSDFMMDLDSAQDEIAIYIKNNDVELISVKIEEMLIKSQNDINIVSKRDGDSIKMRLTQSQNETQDIIKNTIKKKNNNNIILDEHSPNNKVSVNCTQQNIDANCTLPIVDSTKPIYKAKKPSKTNFQSNPNMYTWINAKAKEFNQGLPKDRQFVHPNKSGKTRDERAGNMYMLRNVYEKFGEEKATEFVDYIISKGEWRNPMSILSLKNQEEFENLCQVGEQPRYLNDSWKTMQRFSRPNAEEPVVFDFPMEDALYAAWEWYFNGKGFEGSELVKKVREKIKEINHSRFNKY